MGIVLAYEYSKNPARQEELLKFFRDARAPRGTAEPDGISRQPSPASTSRLNYLSSPADHHLDRISAKFMSQQAFVAVS
jgi:hypothetical protein